MTSPTLNGHAVDFILIRLDEFRYADDYAGPHSGLLQSFRG